MFSTSLLNFQHLLAKQTITRGPKTIIRFKRVMAKFGAFTEVAGQLTIAVSLFNTMKHILIIDL